MVYDPTWPMICYLYAMLEQFVHNYYDNYTCNFFPVLKKIDY